MALQSKLFRGDTKLEAAAASDAAHIVQGAKGDHVRKIQEALIKLDGAGITADGEFGPGTAAAVLAYKRKRGIVNRAYQSQADGIVGKMTIAALDSELQAQPIPPDAGEYQLLCALAQQCLAAIDSRHSAVALAFFNKQRLVLDRMAAEGHTIQVERLALMRGSLAVSRVSNPEVGAVGVAVLVAAVLVIMAFAAAMAIIMAQQSQQSAQEIARLQREFELRLQELNRIISEAPMDTLILIAKMMSEMEAAARARIAFFRQQMEECRKLAGQFKMTKCLELFAKIESQIVHIQSVLAFDSLADKLMNADERRLLLLGLARSFGFLVVLIDKWAKCMGCPFLQFLS